MRVDIDGVGEVPVNGDGYYAVPNVDMKKNFRVKGFVLADGRRGQVNIPGTTDGLPNGVKDLGYHAYSINRDGRVGLTFTDGRSFFRTHDSGDTRYESAEGPA